TDSDLKARVESEKLEVQHALRRDDAVRFDGCRRASGPTRPERSAAYQLAGPPEGHVAAGRARVDAANHAGARRSVHVLPRPTDCPALDAGGSGGRAKSESRARSRTRAGSRTTADQLRGR